MKLSPATERILNSCRVSDKNPAKLGHDHMRAFALDEEFDLERLLELCSIDDLTLMCVFEIHVGAWRPDTEDDVGWFYRRLLLERVLLMQQRDPGFEKHKKILLRLIGDKARYVVDCAEAKDTRKKKK